MSDLNQKVKDLAIELERMKNSLNLAGKKGELSKLEAISTDSKLWDNPENAKKIMQELGNLRKEIDEVEDLEEKLFFFVSLSESEDLSLDFKAEIENLEKRFNKLKLSSFLSGPYDSKNTLVSIHAGQGGTEAMDWVSMLYRMYVRFCEKKGWLTETIDISEGEEAGIKSITFKVEENIISVSGIDKELIGDISSKIRKVRPPDPYKGKGVRYLGEKLRKKVGKAAQKAGVK